MDDAAMMDWKQFMDNMKAGNEAEDAGASSGKSQSGKSQLRKNPVDKAATTKIQRKDVDVNVDAFLTKHQTSSPRSQRGSRRTTTKRRATFKFSQSAPALQKSLHTKKAGLISPAAKRNQGPGTDLPGLLESSGSSAESKYDKGEFTDLGAQLDAGSDFDDDSDDGEIRPQGRYSQGRFSPSKVKSRKSRRRASRHMSRASQKAGEKRIEETGVDDIRNQADDFINSLFKPVVGRAQNRNSKLGFDNTRLTVHDDGSNRKSARSSAANSRRTSPRNSRRQPLGARMRGSVHPSRRATKHQKGGTMFEAAFTGQQPSSSGPRVTTFAEDRVLSSEVSAMLSNSASALDSGLNTARERLGKVRKEGFKFDFSSVVGFQVSEMKRQRLLFKYGALFQRTLYKIRARWDLDEKDREMDRLRHKRRRARVKNKRVDTFIRSNDEVKYVAAEELVVPSPYHGEGNVVFGWNPDATRLATGGRNKQVHVFDQDGHRLGKFGIDEPKTGPIQQLAWDISSTVLACVCLDSRQVTMYDAETSDVFAITLHDLLGDPEQDSDDDTLSVGDSGTASFKSGTASFKSRSGKRPKRKGKTERPRTARTAAREALARGWKSRLNIFGNVQTDEIKNESDVIVRVAWSRNENAEDSSLAICCRSGRVIMYNLEEETHVVVDNLLRPGKITCAAWTSGVESQDGADANVNNNMLIVCNKREMLAVVDSDGDILYQVKLPLVAVSGIWVNDTSREAEMLALNLNHDLMYLLDTSDLHNPTEMQFNLSYGRIVSIHPLDYGYLLIGFSSGYLSIISTHAGNLGLEWMTIQLNVGELLDVSHSEESQFAVVSGTQNVCIVDLAGGMDPASGHWLCPKICEISKDDFTQITGGDGGQDPWLKRRRTHRQQDLIMVELHAAVDICAQTAKPSLYVHFQCGDHIFKSSVQIATQEPVWNEQLFFLIPAVFSKQEMSAKIAKEQEAKTPQLPEEKSGEGTPLNRAATQNLVHYMKLRAQFGDSETDKDYRFSVKICKGEYLSRSTSFTDKTTDPFVELCWNKVKIRTQVRKKDRYPQWDESFQYVHSPADGSSVLTIKVWDYSRWTRNTLIGSWTCDMDEVNRHNDEPFWIDLHNDRRDNTGRLQISFKFILEASDVAELLNSAQEAAKVVMESSSNAPIAVDTDEANQANSTPEVKTPTMQWNPGVDYSQIKVSLMEQNVHDTGFSCIASFKVECTDIPASVPRTEGSINTPDSWADMDDLRTGEALAGTWRLTLDESREAEYNGTDEFHGDVTMVFRRGKVVAPQVMDVLLKIQKRVQMPFKRGFLEKSGLSSDILLGVKTFSAAQVSPINVEWTRGERLTIGTDSGSVHHFRLRPTENFSTSDFEFTDDEEDDSNQTQEERQEHEGKKEDDSNQTQEERQEHEDKQEDDSNQTQEERQEHEDKKEDDSNQTQEERQEHEDKKALQRLDIDGDGEVDETVTESLDEQSEAGAQKSNSNQSQYSGSLAASSSNVVVSVGVFEAGSPMSSSSPKHKQLQITTTSPTNLPTSTPAFLQDFMLQPS